ncbi:hypothetical protein LDO32_14150 [Luteimonas sp. Y-2-2-4F]|nr:hypothetical protein [Luteimonas sp. Y-2-2-4F]MCD9032869.1 hypothetical protein [Luteimonas sp. Y-2-2-4F]
MSTHIAAGAVALAAGALALFSRKGARLHRRSGMLFVAAMLLMAATGAAIAALHAQTLSVVAGALTGYLVATALLTVRRRPDETVWLHAALALAALATGAFGIHAGIDAIAHRGGTIDGNPAQVAIAFGGVAAFAGLLDLRMLLARRLDGRHRIARHLWRMCFALFIAAASFFLGQAQVFPPPLRQPLLLAAPVVLVLLLMLYWLARVLAAGGRRPYRTRRT